MDSKTPTQQPLPKANREMRRAALKLHKKNHKHNIWGEWEHRININTDLGEDRTPNLINGWLNNIFSVQEYHYGGSEARNDYFHWPRIMVKRHDSKPTVTWAEMQRIKNELFGPEMMAIQLFPQESELVDVANMYWMYLVPPHEYYKIKGVCWK